MTFGRPKSQYLKRPHPSYKRAVLWVAANDNPGSSQAFESYSVEKQISVILVAEIFHKRPFDVAMSVIEARRIMCAEPRD